MAVRTSHLALALFPLLVGEGKAQEEQIQNPSNADSNAENLETIANEGLIPADFSSSALFSSMEEARVSDEEVTGVVDGIEYNVIAAYTDLTDRHLQLEIKNIDGLALFLPQNSIANLNIFRYVEFREEQYTHPGSVYNKQLVSSFKAEDAFAKHPAVDILGYCIPSEEMLIISDHPERIITQQEDGPLFINIGKQFFDLVQAIYDAELHREGLFKDIRPLKAKTSIPTSDRIGTKQLIEEYTKGEYGNICGWNYNVVLGEDCPWAEGAAARTQADKYAVGIDHQFYVTSINYGIDSSAFCSPERGFLQLVEQETGRTIFLWLEKPSPDEWLCYIGEGVFTNGTIDEKRFVQDLPCLVEKFKIRGPFMINNDIFEQAGGIPDTYNSFFQNIRTLGGENYKVVMFDRK